jgi:glycosyltransferase involved in cell wall biosynthesis
MNVVVTCEHHFARTPDGRVWTDGQVAYSFWTRYLSVFDSVRVVARVRDVTVLPPKLQLASGAGVSFWGVSDYRGPEQYLLRAMSIASATTKAVRTGDAVILRVISACLERLLCKKGRPYGVEVVGDPYDAFAPKAVRHPLRPLFRWLFPRHLRRVCGRACAAAYVTMHALQRRYPPAPQAFTTHYSSVELPLEAFAKVPRGPRPIGSAKLIFVGTMAQLYKGPDVLIDAVGESVHDGRDVELVLVGSGRCRTELESRAVALGLGNRVQFRGQLTTPEAVRAELDQADLFVLPSRQEGLPRPMIEAMARALPCVGSMVGGTPELVPAEDLVPPNDAPALASKISEVLADPARMARMSARNLAKAREYSAALGQRRQAFYCHVKAQTHAWLQPKGASFRLTPAEAAGRKR